MAFTPKQERNGATGSGGEQNSAQPGPMADVASVAAHATEAGNGRKNDPGMFDTPAGAGPSGASSASNPGRVLANPGGSVWEWDAGLAIDEQRGEA